MYRIILTSMLEVKYIWGSWS